MHRLRISPGMLAITAAMLLATAVAMPAAAAQKTGCGGPGSGWTSMSVNQAAAAIWPTLLDPGFDGSEAALAADIATVDGNGDDTICMKQIWGDHLNPNSNWYRIGVELIGSPTVASTIHDNNANGS